MSTLKHTIIFVNKLEQIAKLESTKRRQNLGDIFIGQKGEESASRGDGLKILTPNQMLYQCFTNALPNQMQITNFFSRIDSEKLKNEIRYLLYSLYRSKKL